MRPATTVAGTTVNAILASGVNFVQLTSGQNVVQLASGTNFVTISGPTFSVSGNAVSVSGNFINVNISGAIIQGNFSGAAVTVSGNIINTSGQVAAISGQAVTTSVSGQAVTISGNIININGSTVTISGNVVNISGSIVTISGNTIRQNIPTNVRARNILLATANSGGSTLLSGDCSQITIRSLSGNAGVLFVGGVTTNDAPWGSNAVSGAGFVLGPGDGMTFPITNFNLVAVAAQGATTSGDRVSYFGVDY